jgi:hypothetical protein
MQWAFFVTMQYSIQHRTDGHFNPDSYSAWADALYAALRSRLFTDETNSLGTTNQPRSIPTALVGSGKQQPPPVVTESNTSVGTTTDKPGTVEVPPPTNADVKVTLKQTPTQTVTATASQPPTQIQNANGEPRPLTPAEIQTEARALTRDCAERFSSAANGIKWWSQFPTGGPMIGQEWKQFTDYYDKNLKDRMFAMHQLLESGISSVPPKGIDAQYVFNMPSPTPNIIKDRLTDLFILLNEFEKENRLTITKWD